MYKAARTPWRIAETLYNRHAIRVVFEKSSKMQLASEDDLANCKHLSTATVDGLKHHQGLRQLRTTLSALITSSPSRSPVPQSSIVCAMQYRSDLLRGMASPPPPRRCRQCLDEPRQDLRQTLSEMRPP